MGPGRENIERGGGGGEGKEARKREGKKQRNRRSKNNSPPFSSLSLPLLLLQKKNNRTAWTIDAEAKALRHVSASTAALIYSSEPLWGAAFAAIFLGERFEGARGWFGAFLVIGSSLVAQVGGAAGKDGKVGERSESTTK